MILRNVLLVAMFFLWNGLPISWAMESASLAKVHSFQGLNRYDPIVLLPVQDVKIGSENWAFKLSEKASYEIQMNNFSLKAFLSIEDQELDLNLMKQDLNSSPPEFKGLFHNHGQKKTFLIFYFQKDLEKVPVVVNLELEEMCLQEQEKWGNLLKPYQKDHQNFVKAIDSLEALSFQEKEVLKANIADPIDLALGQKVKVDEKIAYRVFFQLGLVQGENFRVRKHDGGMFSSGVFVGKSFSDLNYCVLKLLASAYEVRHGLKSWDGNTTLIQGRDDLKWDHNQFEALRKLAKDPKFKALCNQHAENPKCFYLAQPLEHGFYQNDGIGTVFDVRYGVVFEGALGNLLGHYIPTIDQPTCFSFKDKSQAAQIVEQFGYGEACLFIPLSTSWSEGKKIDLNAGLIHYDMHKNNSFIFLKGQELKVTLIDLDWLYLSLVKERSLESELCKPLNALFKACESFFTPKEIIQKYVHGFWLGVEGIINKEFKSLPKAKVTFQDKVFSLERGENKEELERELKKRVTVLCEFAWLGKADPEIYKKGFNDSKEDLGY